MIGASTKPLKNHPFANAVLYVFVVLVLAGGSGIWVPAFTPNHTLGADAIFAFVMAAIGPLATDMVLQKSPTIKTQLGRLVFMAASAVTATIALVAFLHEKDSWSLSAGLFSAAMCVVIWIVVYRGHDMFKEEPMPSPPAPSLGDPNQLLGGGVP